MFNRKDNIEKGLDVQGGVDQDVGRIIDPESVYVREEYSPAKWRLTAGIFWDTFKTPPRERRFVQRLDFFFFSYSLLSYFFKYLDQANISNAYVSGMATDLQLNGQQRNLFTTYFNIGYLIGSLPTQIIIAKTRASYFIPCCELLWSILTMCLSASKDAKTIYGIRFIIGLSEATVFPGLVTVLGSWYAPEELGKRTALFEMTSSAAQMVAGYIQAGVYAQLNGRHGMAGWRWAFLIDGIISLPVAVMGFFCIPDHPSNCRVLWLSKKKKAYGSSRMLAIGRKPPRELTIKRLLKFLVSPRPWVFTFPYILCNVGNTTGYFNLWLNDVGRYTTEQVNVIPSGGYAITIVASYLLSLLGDVLGKRYIWAIVSVIFSLVANIMLSVWNIPFGALMAANFINFIGIAASPIVSAWGEEAYQDDAEARQLILGFGNTFNYAMTAWLPLVIFPTPQAPHYKVGYQVSAAILVLEILSILGFFYYLKWEQKRLGKVINEFGLAVEVSSIENYGSHCPVDEPKNQIGVNSSEFVR
ncbi:major facilitator superfamily domain-containing protein [Dipodascopsis uninucleata]